MLQGSSRSLSGDQPSREVSEIVHNLYQYTAAAAAVTRLIPVLLFEHLFSDSNDAAWCNGLLFMLQHCSYQFPPHTCIEMDTQLSQHLACRALLFTCIIMTTVELITAVLCRAVPCRAAPCCYGLSAPVNLSAWKYRRSHFSCTLRGHSSKPLTLQLAFCHIWAHLNNL